MAILRVTVTNVVLGGSDKGEVDPYIPAIINEQINTEAKRIRDQNKWIKKDCETTHEIIDN